MDPKNIIEYLSPHEIKVLIFLKKTQDLEKLQSLSKLKNTEVIRSLQWLENKKLVQLETLKSELIKLDKNGKDYLKNGLPEKRFLEAIITKPLPLNQISKKAKLNKEELNLCIGLLKNHNLVKLSKEVSITNQGKKALKNTDLEKLLRSLPKEINKINPKEKELINYLKQRKEIILIEEIKTRKIILTELGEKISKQNLKTDLIETLTPEMLQKATWKNKKFRRYDITAPVPKLNPGKRHFVKQAIKYAKKVWTDMGFQEMTGPIIDSGFWTFDSLFVPQDHPAREMQDTFYLDGSAKLPDKKLLNKVKLTHEKGWKYKYNESIAQKLVLRPHTTNLSARTLSKLKKEDLPAKFFAIGRNYRNEAIDWKHIPEFNQTEGIVIGKDLNFRDLLGYLKEFFKKMGFPKARFRPAYFPYTEPSIEIDVFHPIKKQWIELGGAGMFRPEVIKPLLGEDVQVLAWGPGFDRIIIDYFNIQDLRELYKNDIKQLREIKGWLK